MRSSRRRRARLAGDGIAMSTERRSVEVHADWLGLERPRRMGMLHATLSRGKELFSFEYDPAWLVDGQALDPALPLIRGAQFPARGRETFGVFLDSSPDRWGRVLLQRREARLARSEGRKVRPLFGLDYLLGVFDGHRVGALRYRIPGGPFLDDNAALASPPWTAIRDLEAASLHLESDTAEDDPSYDTWLRMLVAPGRSLGGARPKASVVDETGRLWIAKFPSRSDIEDVGAWEHVAHQLARRAGLSVPEATNRRFGGAHHTFLSRRFDRTAKGERQHFASAMTLLEREDGEEGASYLDLAEVLKQSGAHPSRDLEELWRRIVFFVLISNVDDHLRNHGFLLEPAGGWSLAPAYDVNPVATGGGLTLNISETDNAQDLALVLEVAADFRVAAARSREVVDEVTAAVAGWRVVATASAISRAAQDRMAPAFKVG